MAGGDILPKARENGGRVRVQRKLLPTAVTCIAFRHKVPSPQVSPYKTDQHETALKYIEKDNTTSREEPDLLVHHQTSEQGSVTTAEVSTLSGPLSSGEGSIMLTGDEVGSVKIWDLTATLYEKLGPVTCSGKSTEDKAAIPPAADGTKSRQSLHYREGPLDGVGIQAAIRFRELIKIAKSLRRGNHLPSTEMGPENGRGISSVGPNEVTQPGMKNVGPAVEINHFGPDQLASCVPERTRSRSLVRSSSAETDTHRFSIIRCKRDSQSSSGGSCKSIQRPSAVASDAPDRQTRAVRPKRPKEEVDAVLNRYVDAIEPVASWMGHKDSITSIQVCPILDLFGCFPSVSNTHMMATSQKLRVAYLTPYLHMLHNSSITVFKQQLLQELPAYILFGV